MSGYEIDGENVVGKRTDADGKEIYIIKEPIRKLNSDERFIYATALHEAVTIVPAFRDAISLLSPFYDYTASTAYTDKHARVGLGPWFFELDRFQGATVILHECMHVLNNHFQRSDLLNMNPEMRNLSGDLEINTGLNMLPKADISMGILPGKEPFMVPDNLSMEQYYHLLNTDEMKEKLEQLQKEQTCPKHNPKPDNPGVEQEKEDGDSEKSDRKNQSGSSNADESGGEGSCEADNPNNDAQSGDSNSSSSNSGSDSDGDSGNSQDGNSNSGDAKSGSDVSAGGDQPGKSNGGKGSGEPECTCGRDGEGSGQQSSSGKGLGKSAGGNSNKSCDNATEERELAADAAGIDKASSAEQEIAKKNTLARIVEHQKSTGGRGDGALDAFLKLTEMRMNPPKVKWQSILNKAMSTANDAIVRGRADYSYRRSNRRFQDSKYIFPGMVKYIPKLMFAFDTSGSMGNEDYHNLLLEVEGIIKASTRGKDNLAVFPIDTTIKGIQRVKSIKDIKIIGGGGTDMSVGVHYVNELPAREKPNIFVLATDGYTEWGVYEQRLLDANKKYIHILLVTTKGGYATVPESLKRLCTVIDISSEDDNRPQW